MEAYPILSVRSPQSVSSLICILSYELPLVESKLFICIYTYIGTLISIAEDLILHLPRDVGSSKEYRDIFILVLFELNSIKQQHKATHKKIEGTPRETKQQRRIISN